MAVNINVPSQVKTYANLAAFPATGALKTIYIAEDTNKTYRWTGSVYTEISASAAMTWGQIGGTLSNQTDLQNALDAKVPTSRTLTINGVTQDLSANRTFTISTGITIGSTAIASGVVGRVLFEGAGNVVQQSSSLFWDNTNARLGIGTSSPSDVITLLQPIGFQSILRFQTLDNTTANGYSGFNCFDNSGSLAFSFAYGNPNSLLPNSAIIGPRNATGRLSFVTGSSAVSQITMFPSGNLLLQNGGTHTDAGFKLDVNGTARVSSNISGIYDGLNVRNSAGASNAQARIKFDNDITPTQTTTGGVVFYTSSVFSGFPSSSFGLWNYNSNGVIAFATNSTERLRIFSTGNVGINTTTDSGFRLDVNGTARVQGNTTVSLNQNNITSLTLSNTTNNANASVRFYLQGDSTASQVGKLSSSYASGAILKAGDYFFYNQSVGNITFWNNLSTGTINFTTGTGTSPQMTLFSTGNIGINTTTDAGFKFDVNGTARVSGNTTVTGSISLGTNQSIGDGNFSVNVNRLESYNAYRIRTLADNRYVYLSPGNTDILYANYWAGGNFAGVVVQDVAGTTQSTTAVLQANSTTRGFLPPRMTTTQKNAIASPAAGLMVYDTTLNVISYYNGTTWITL